jgi:hypothetical protein
LSERPSAAAAQRPRSDTAKRFSSLGPLMAPRPTVPTISVIYNSWPEIHTSQGLFRSQRVSEQTNGGESAQAPRIRTIAKRASLLISPVLPKWNDPKIGVLDVFPDENSQKGVRADLLLDIHNYLGVISAPIIFGPFSSTSDRFLFISVRSRAQFLLPRRLRNWSM